MSTSSAESVGRVSGAARRVGVVLTLAAVLCGMGLGAPALAATGPSTAAPAAVATALQTQQLVSAARSQIGRTTLYDPAYVRLSFPGGDVPMERGVCTDVVIRAFRSIGLDLQLAVYNDMAKNMAAYPKAGRSRPDPNIDHRRVRNLSVFFTRKGAAVPSSQNAADYLPGDIVMWDVGGLAHTGLVADAVEPGTNRRLIVHNIGSGAQLEDILFAFPITGHFRYLPGQLAPSAA